jgi:hypothetical protein
MLFYSIWVNDSIDVISVTVISLNCISTFTVVSLTICNVLLFYFITASPLAFTSTGVGVWCIVVLMERQWFDSVHCKDSH